MLWAGRCENGRQEGAREHRASATECNPWWCLVRSDESLPPHARRASAWLFAVSLLSTAAHAIPTGLVVSADSPDDQEADRLFEVDLGTGQSVSRGALAQIYEDVESLAFDAAGTLYGIDDATKTLLHIDTRTGATTIPGRVTGNTRLAASLSEIDDPGLTFTCSGQLLLSSTRGKLYKVQPDDGVATQIGSGITMATGITDLAAYGDRVFGLGRTGLYRIDPDSGTSALVGEYGHGVQFNGGGGVAFDDVGMLWAIADRSPNGASAVYRIEPTTGAATAAGTVAVKGIDSLTIGPTHCGPAVVTGAVVTAVPVAGRGGLWTVLALIGLTGLLSLRCRGHVELP